MLRRAKSDKDGSDRFGQGTRILVVGDDPDAGELIVRILEFAGWSATKVQGYDEAMRALLTTTPRLTAVVSDFTSGGVSSSLKLLDAVRHEEGLEDLPVIILTASLTNRGFAWQSGTDGFLVRPFHADDLVNEIYACLTRTPEEREAYRREQAATA